MKHTAFFISILTLGTFIVSSCGGDHNEPDEENIFMNKLAQTWTLTSGHVTVDGVDVTTDFAGLTITFDANKHYTTAHGVPPIWPAAGSFTLQKTTDNAYDLLRDDGLRISIQALTDRSITFTFQYTYAGGRTTSVSGKYQFSMNR